MGETFVVVMYLLPSDRAIRMFGSGDLNVRGIVATADRALSCYLQQMPCESWLSPGLCQHLLLLVPSHSECQADALDVCKSQWPWKA